MKKLKKLNVDHGKCIGCGACVAIDPEHFEFNDEGKSSVISNENIETENVQNAIESCPTGAISIEDGTEDSCDCDACEEDSCDCSKCEGCSECEEDTEN